MDNRSKIKDPWSGIGFVGDEVFQFWHPDKGTALLGTVTEMVEVGAFGKIAVELHGPQGQVEYHSIEIAEGPLKHVWVIPPVELPMHATATDPDGETFTASATVFAASKEECREVGRRLLKESLAIRLARYYDRGRRFRLTFTDPEENSQEILDVG